MSTLSQANVDLLSLHNILLKKETKSSAIIKFSNCEDDIRMSRAMYDVFLNSIKNALKRELELPKITFGVELEFVGSRSYSDMTDFSVAMYNLVGPNYYNSFNQYMHNDGSMWILSRDGSISTADSKLDEPYNFELSSPKLDLFNDNDLNILKNVLVLVKRHLHGEVNNTCGTHIHLGFEYTNILKKDVRHLMYYYAKMENKIFDPVVPIVRRRNKYCKHTSVSLIDKYCKLSARYCTFECGLCDCLRFEARQLEGTLDFVTIKNWALLQSYIICDLLCHRDNNTYCDLLANKNIFDILLTYSFSSDIVEFFIKRLVNFRSRMLTRS